jgi:hypothetical protein
MLKARRIDEIGPGQVRYALEEDGRPASNEALERLVVFGRRLLAENDVRGALRIDGEGIVILDLDPATPSYYQSGILFAALDAFNNPGKNPTITRLTPPDGKSRGGS